MMTTVSGTYEDGRITFDEELPIKPRKAKVHVTFVEEIEDEPIEPKPKRQFGAIKGTFTGDYWFSEEFNDPIDDLKDYM